MAARNGSSRCSNGSARRKVLRWLRAQGRPCHICGQPIDYGITDANDPRHFECDELLPVSLGGSPTDRANVDAAHRFCNQWRGNRMQWSRLEARAALARAVARRMPAALPPHGRTAPPRKAAVRHSREW